MIQIWSFKKVVFKKNPLLALAKFVAIKLSIYIFVTKHSFSPKVNKRKEKSKRKAFGMY